MTRERISLPRKWRLLLQQFDLVRFVSNRYSSWTTNVCLEETVLDITKLCMLLQSHMNEQLTHLKMVEILPWIEYMLGTTDISSNAHISIEFFDEDDDTQTEEYSMQDYVFGLD